MRAFVTGGAGFIGSHLSIRLLREGYEVAVLDNFSRGSRLNLKADARKRGFELMEGDCKSEKDVAKAIRGADIVFHFAANSEIRYGWSNPLFCFQENVIATEVVLEAVREQGISDFVLASSSTVYGDATVHPTPENASLNPISIYGASKLACESLLTGYANLYGFRAKILRLANIVGPRSGHGVAFDFVEKLKKNPGALTILGDGNQTKSYLFIDDCIDAITKVVGLEGVSVFNVGSDDQLSVKEIADLVCEKMNLRPTYRFDNSLEGKGWPGDVKDMLLDTMKLKSLGWEPSHSSREAVSKLVDWYLRAPQDG